MGSISTIPCPNQPAYSEERRNPRYVACLSLPQSAQKGSNSAYDTQRADSGTHIAGASSSLVRPSSFSLRSSMNSPNPRVCPNSTNPRIVHSSTAHQGPRAAPTPTSEKVQVCLLQAQDFPAPAASWGQQLVRRFGGRVQVAGFGRQPSPKPLQAFASHQCRDHCG